MKLKPIVAISFITAGGGLVLILIAGLFIPHSLLVRWSSTKQSSVTHASNGTSTGRTTGSSSTRGHGSGDQKTNIGTTTSSSTPGSTSSAGSDSSTPPVGGGTGPPPPGPVTSISSFSASPVSIAYQASSTLSWASANATTCTIAPSIGAVATNGSRSTGALSSSTTFTLTCGGNGSVSKQVSVTVASPPPACGQAGGTCSAAQVAGHNAQTDCWMIYAGKWYVVTSYVNVHPGGRAVFNAGSCGVDATGYLNGTVASAGQKHTHSQSAYNTLMSFTGGPVQ